MHASTIRGGKRRWVVRPMKLARNRPELWRDRAKRPTCTIGRTQCAVIHRINLTIVESYTRVSGHRLHRNINNHRLGRYNQSSQITKCHPNPTKGNFRQKIRRVLDSQRHRNQFKASPWRLVQMIRINLSINSFKNRRNIWGSPIYLKSGIWRCRKTCLSRNVSWMTHQSKWRTTKSIQ